MSTLTVRDVIKRYLSTLSCKRPESAFCQLKPVGRLLGNHPAEDLRGYHLTDYRACRREEGVCDTTINRELSYLRAAYNRALDEELIERKPRFRLARENNAREQWICLSELRRLLKEFSPDLRDYVEFLWWTGWRRSQTAALKWQHYDERKGFLMAPGQVCKSGHPTAYPLVGYVQQILARRKRKRKGPWIFHRRGHPIRDFRVAWQKATERAGLKGLHVHDLRRSMATYHLELGIPQASTMRLAGWLTDSMYRRYAIVHRESLVKAAKRAMDGESS